MSKSEILIRSILGPSRLSIRPMAYSLDRAEELLFQEHRSMEELYITKDIYPAVAQRLNMRTSNIAKRTEVVAKCCWKAMADKGLLEQYIGDAGTAPLAPHQVVYYLAYYLHYGRSFHEVMKELLEAGE